MAAGTTLDENNNRDQHVSPIARLFHLGKEQSFVTYDDILQFFPFPEQDLDQLDRIFGALLCAGIPYGEDADHLDCHGEWI